MSKIQLKCISPFQVNEILEVEAGEANALIQTGQYILIENNSGEIIEKGVKKKHDSKN